MNHGERARPRAAGLAVLSLAAGCMVMVGSAGVNHSASAVDSASVTSPAPEGRRARVTEVTDGDSIKVRIVRSGAPRNVRLIGIDTPEVHGRVECGGPEASRSLKRMLPIGQIVRLVRDPEQDNRDLFNRLLRYVVKPDGKDAGRRQLRRGWAQVFIFGGETFGRLPSYQRASDAAEASGRGSWDVC